MQSVIAKLTETQFLGQENYKWLFTGLAISVATYLFINRKINGYFFTRSATLSMDERKSVKNKTVIITGGNSGLGLASAIEFAKMDARVLVTVRSDKKGQYTQNAVQSACGKKIDYAVVDCADLDSISSFVQNLDTSQNELRSIILNAGIITNTDSEPKEYPGSDGKSIKFTEKFVVNYLGHWLMTSLLTNRIISAAKNSKVSVVSVSSGAHESANLDPARLIDNEATKSCSYGQSKLLQILHMKELQRRLDNDNVICSAITPGLAKTAILSKGVPSMPWALQMIAPIFTTMFGRTAKQGCQVIIQAALNESTKPGGYYSNCLPKPPQFNKKHLTDSQWQASSELAWISTEEVLNQAGIAFK